MSNDNIKSLKKLLPTLEEVAGSGLIKKSSSEYAGPCPVCGGNDRFFWTPGKDSGHCRQCEKNYDVLDIEMRRTGKTIPELLVEYGIEGQFKKKHSGQSKQTEKTEKQKKTRKNKKSIPGWRLAEKDNQDIHEYFKSRGITFDDTFPKPPTIRFSSFKDKKTGEIRRSIVFAAVNITNYTCIDATARLWLDDTGAKINRTYGKNQDFTGKGVWFDKKRSLAESKLIIGEGVETVLSAMQATGINGVAGLDSGKMLKVALPNQVTELFILVDEDILKPGAKKGYAGQVAALKLAEKFENSRSGRIAWLCTPSDTCFTEKPVKNDFNDIDRDEILERFEKKCRRGDIDWKPPVHEDERGEEQEDDGLEAELQKLNKNHAAVLIGGKFRILRDGFDYGNNRHTVSFMDRNAFMSFFANKSVWVDNGDKKIKISVPKAWIEWERRRTYSDIAFEPGNGIEDDVYNLFRGFPVKPKKGSWELMHNHIYSVICGGYVDLFDYVLGWMARAVQDPGGDRPGVALVLKGGKGVGKGIFAGYFGRIFGEAFLPIADSDNFTGRFNMHLSKSLLVFLDEAVWGGDKKAEGKLKALITEPTILFEPKGIDSITMRNYMNIIIASNEDWVVPATGDERRFCVLTPNNSMVGDFDYFDRIAQERDNGGVEAMMYDLLKHDYSKVNLRSAPKTEGLRDQVAISLGPEDLFWVTLVSRGYVLSDDGIPTKGVRQGEMGDFFEGFYFNFEIINEFRQFCCDQKIGHPPSPEKFWANTWRWWPGGKPVRLNKRYNGSGINGLLIPDKSLLEKELAEKIGVSIATDEKVCFSSNDCPF